MGYTTLLLVHSWLRWAFLFAALYAIIRSINGKINNKPFGKEDNTAATVLVALTHTMLLLGLILWFISPYVQNALSQGASVFMKNSVLRSMVIEHPLINIIAVFFIQFGRIVSKKAYEDSSKHMRSLIYYGLGLLLILSKIPWGTAPLFRGME
ncbi:MAG: hypothetical protein ACOYMA_12095 [Bacteroidia bacterium]